jgi:hypothetical protein
MKGDTTNILSTSAFGRGVRPRIHIDRCRGRSFVLKLNSVVRHSRDWFATNFARALRYEMYELGVLLWLVMMGAVPTRPLHVVELRRDYLAN